MSGTRLPMIDQQAQENFLGLSGAFNYQYFEGRLWRYIDDSDRVYVCTTNQSVITDDITPWSPHVLVLFATDYSELLKQRKYQLDSDYQVADLKNVVNTALSDIPAIAAADSDIKYVIYNCPFLRIPMMNHMDMIVWDSDTYTFRPVTQTQSINHNYLDDNGNIDYHPMKVLYGSDSDRPAYVNTPQLFVASDGTTSVFNVPRGKWQLLPFAHNVGNFGKLLTKDGGAMVGDLTIGYTIDSDTDSDILVSVRYVLNRLSADSEYLDALSFVDTPADATSDTYVLSGSLVSNIGGSSVFLGTGLQIPLSTINVKSVLISNTNNLKFVVDHFSDFVPVNMAITVNDNVVDYMCIENAIFVDSDMLVLVDQTQQQFEVEINTSLTTADSVLITLTTHDNMVTYVVKDSGSDAFYTLDNTTPDYGLF